MISLAFLWNVRLLGTYFVIVLLDTVVCQNIFARMHTARSIPASGLKDLPWSGETNQIEGKMDYADSGSGALW